MSFFNDFGKKISSGSQEAIAKAKDFADVAKLNSNISDEERRINANFTEIGKMYFESHKDDFDEMFADQFTSIKECQEKIKDLQRQITAIKGVVKCPNCGAEVAKDSAFCPSCGTAIPKEEPVAEESAEDIPTVEAEVVEPAAETKKCPKCGAELEEGAAFCVNCGEKVEEIA